VVIAMAKNSPTLKEIHERQQREQVALAALGLSGKVGDLPLDIRRLAVIVAQLVEQQTPRKRK
jgi:hypothetical protein